MRHNICTSILAALLASHAVNAAVMSDDHPTPTTATAAALPFSDIGSSLVTSDKGYADQYAAVPVAAATVGLYDPVPAKGLTATQLYASDAIMALAEAGLYAFLAAFVL
ncbi:hypothetical protein BJ741DRAFT_605918 [Chytriomyces cf. hyalinus JEL632]|nr:hypothetical protein BJ741DRAFT_605918 [Chytriomyces cf. hyalinus JEL632]